MRSQVPGIVLIMGSALVVAACTAEQAERAGETRVASADHRSAGHSLPAAGFMRNGDSFATMAQQYTPRAGPYAATGASAWVAPSPPPAFIARGPLPAADPPAPPPAAVANRQPSPAPAVAATPRAPTSAADLVRPEAATPATPAPAPAPAPAAPSPALRTAGLALFNNYSCNACHVLADAGAAGSIGPALDRNPSLTRPFVIDVVSNGRGAMPSFAGQMTAAEIATLADYIVQFARK